MLSDSFELSPYRTLQSLEHITRERSLHHHYPLTLSAADTICSGSESSERRRPRRSGVPNYTPHRPLRRPRQREGHISPPLCPGCGTLPSDVSATGTTAGRVGRIEAGGGDRSGDWRGSGICVTGGSGQQHGGRNIVSRGRRMALTARRRSKPTSGDHECLRRPNIRPRRLSVSRQSLEAADASLAAYIQGVPKKVSRF